MRGGPGLTLQISVNTHGGVGLIRRCEAQRLTTQHSSVPPVHTGIGIMADVVSALEDHPFENKASDRG